MTAVKKLAADANEKLLAADLGFAVTSAVRGLPDGAERLFRPAFARHYGGDDVRRRAAEALARLARRSSCPAGMDSCAAKCCPEGATCGGGVGSCPAGAASCPPSPGGGCCIPGYVCQGVGCRCRPPTALYGR